MTNPLDRESLRSRVQSALEAELDHQEQVLAELGDAAAQAGDGWVVAVGEGVDALAEQLGEDTHAGDRGAQLV